MDSNNPLQFLHNGLRVSLGAATSLIETLQDPQKRQENFSQLSSQLHQQVIEWEQKGEITEREARSFVEQLLRQQGNSGGSATTGTTSRPSTPSPAPVSPTTQQEIEELTEQIASLRTELENLRQSD